MSLELTRDFDVSEITGSPCLSANVSQEVYLLFPCSYL